MRGILFPYNLHTIIIYCVYIALARVHRATFAICLHFVGISSLVVGVVVVALSKIVVHPICRYPDCIPTSGCLLDTDCLPPCRDNQITYGTAIAALPSPPLLLLLWRRRCTRPCICYTFILAAGSRPQENCVGN